ncbi:MAG: DsrE/DsrF/DrsH-like family protein [Candidatus Binatia bacterium]
MESVMKAPSLESGLSKAGVREDNALAMRVEQLEKELEELKTRMPEDRATIVVFSGDLDKVLASFVIATGAAAAGLETSMFFTFWGLCALKKEATSAAAARTLKEKMFAMMTPSGSKKLGVSRMNFFGVGATMLRSMMKEKGIASLEELMEIAKDLGVKIIACTMSMDAMGVSKDELVDNLEYGGVATYMADASRSKVTLFV